MNDSFPWQLMQPAASVALLMEFMRWISLWLSVVSVMALVTYLLGVALLSRGSARASQPARQPLGEIEQPLAININHQQSI